MGYVLEKAKQEQVIARGRLGWSLRRIEAATGVRRETAGGYLSSAGPRTGELRREHLSGKRGGHHIRAADRPRRTPPPLLQLLAGAHRAGANIGAICDAIHARQGDIGMRRIQGRAPTGQAIRQPGFRPSLCGGTRVARPGVSLRTPLLQRSPQARLTLLAKSIHSSANSVSIAT